MFEVCCMKQAHSSPYIRARLNDDDTELEEKENSVPAVMSADESISQPALRTVHFNAGCSCSSTDLSNLVDFYNESSDEFVVKHWMNLYQEQKDQARNNIPTATSNRAVSMESLKKTCVDKKDYMSKCFANRSMDRLPTINEGFFALEKCYSADFPPSDYHLPPSRLARSKEYANFADIVDYGD
jgi:hypothetical protein